MLPYIFFAVIFSLISCQSSEFNGTTSPKKESPVPQQPATVQPPDTVTESFSLEAGKRTPVDLVWTIDNSGSMADNIAQVRKNFDAFMASLASRLDVRVILISLADGSFGLKLPASAQGGSQIAVNVGSYDAAAIAAAASCPREANSSVCGVRMTFLANTVGAIAGKATELFRPEAARSYVFVTDDNSIVMKGDQFVTVLKNLNTATLPKVYSFRGINKGTVGCNIANVGTEYAVMESATGGQAFDICTEDWSSSFSQLASSIAAASNPTFTIKRVPDLATLKVFLDDKELSATEYTVSGQTVTLKTPPDVAAAHVVKVTFVPTKP